MKSHFWMVLCCVLCLVGCLAAPVTAAAEPTTAPVASSTTSAPADPDDAQEEAPSKTVRIVEFLAIFTVAAGITAFLVIRPKWKLLQEAKQQQKHSSQQ